MADMARDPHATKVFEQDKTRSITYVVQKAPGQVVGRFIVEETIINTWEGPQTARPGDFQVYGSEGESWPISGEKFPDKYQVIGPFVGTWPRPSDNPSPRFGPFEFTSADRMFLAEKRPTETRAFQTYVELDLLRIDDDPLRARAGDWVIVYEEPKFDDAGNLIDMDAYPCEKSAFDNTYRVLREADEQAILPDAETIARAWEQ